MVEHDQFPQSREDAALDRQLLALKHFIPREQFEDQVMARVRMRSSKLVRFRERSRALLTPARVWWGSGIAAAGATAWSVALVSMLSSVRLDALAEFLSARLFQPASTGLTQASAYGASALSIYAHSAYAALGNALFGMIAASMFLPLVSGWGLYQTMKQPRGKRIAAYAAR
jgi:hypothetical protein